MLIDLVARLLHRSLSTTHCTTTLESPATRSPTQQPPAATEAEAVARHLVLFARLLPGAPHARAFVWEVREVVFVCLFVCFLM